MVARAEAVVEALVARAEGWAARWVARADGSAVVAREAAVSAAGAVGLATVGAVLVEEARAVAATVATARKSKRSS